MPSKTFGADPTGHSRRTFSQAHLLERLEPRVLFAAANLDPGFSGDGKAVVDFVGSRNDYATAIAVLNDGRLLVAGDGDDDTPGGMVARYLADGRPDTSFGQRGKVQLADLGYADVGALAVFADGSFIAGGSRPASPNPTADPYMTVRKFTATGAPDPAWVGLAGDIKGWVSDVIPLAGGKSLVVAGSVWKLNANGTPDTSFGGGDGVAYGGLRAYAAALQTNGSIVLAGHAATVTLDHAGVARLNPSGAVDTAFGSNGTTLFGRGFFTSLLVQPDGRIVAGGFNGGASSVVRLNTNGTRDAGFGTNGERTFELDAAPFGSERVMGLLRRTDGSIQMGGLFAGTKPYLARVRSNGQLDPAFGGDGIIEQHLPAGWTGAGMATVASGLDGRLIVAAAGAPSLNDTLDIALTRHGSDGSRDTTFGGAAAGGAPGGIVRTDATASVARQVGRSALQPDGKVLLTGSQSNLPASFLLARLNASGAPDAAFGGRGDGVAVVDFGERREFARDVAVQADGKLVVVGRVDDGEAPGDPATHPGDYAVACFNASGALDTTFGTGGKVRTNFGGTGEGFSLVEVQADGKILAAGTAGDIGAQSVAIIRYLANGQLDASFGDGGRAVLQSWRGVSTILPLAGGGVLVAGGVSVARLTPAGRLDTTFGAAGTGYTHLNANANVGLAVGAAGHLYVAGTHGSDYGFAVTRLSPGGVVDGGFGNGGTVRQPWGPAPTAFLSTPGGQLLLTGGGGSADFEVTRLQADGSRDASFGNDGTKSIDMGSRRDAAADVHLDGSGRIVVTGGAVIPPPFTPGAFQMNHWAVARLNGSGVAPPPAVTGAQFVPTVGRQVLRLTFSGDVYDKLNAGRRVVVSDHFGGFNYPSSQYLVTRGGAGGPTTVELVFSGSSALRNGNYLATLQPGDVTDGQGIPMVAPFSFDFFVLAGDINQDRAVNGSDFAILAGNFGKTGMTYGQGDLNGDGAVNGSDFALLAGAFGRTLPAPAPLVTAAVRSPAPPAASVKSAPPRTPLRPRRVLPRGAPPQDATRRRNLGPNRGGANP